MTFADPLGLVGVKLGPYVVREAITEGGVAVIYRGEHESLQSAVAVKVLIPDAVVENLRPTLEQMFLREAQILSQLRSEDILRALDHGRVVCPADGVERPYIVTDFLVGRPLSDDLVQRTAEVPRRPYTLEEAVTVLEPIARALSVCHANGIVHRDVNPRNVFLEDAGPGRPPRAKLIDFGFAKEVYRTEALRLETVDATLFARSPDYAAPEHYDREQYGELSETTDTYTLALMLVEMLTLERPLRGVTDTDLWLATKDEDDRPTPNNRGARVSPRVEALFAEAVAVDQLKRPQVLSDWWERLSAATRPGLLEGAPGAPRGVADSGNSAASRSGSGNARGSRDGRGNSRDTRDARDARDARDGASARGFDDRADDNGDDRDGADRDGDDQDGADHDGDDRDGADHDGDDHDDAGGDSTRSEEATARRRIERTQRKRKSAGVFVALALLLVAAAGGAAWWRLRPVQCAAGFADCNGERADGCETAIATDRTSCGACGIACPKMDSVACVAGKCAVTNCAAGTADCDANVADGCETDVAKDTAHCGACARTCGAEGTRSVACAAGKCELACKPAMGDCNGDSADGCETSTSKDAKNCGKCGVTCKDGCVDGLCAPSVLASGVTATHLAASGGTVYYWDSGAHRLERVRAGEKPSVVADGVTDVGGVTVVGDRLLWTTGGGVYSRSVSSEGSAAPERIAGPLLGATPLVASSKNGYVAWALRAAPGAAKKETKHAAVPGEHRRVVAAAIAERGKPATSIVECNEWPRTFAADDHDVYCCDFGTPLASISCNGAACTHHDLGVACPDEVALDAERAYFAVDVRLYAMNRKSSALTLLAKRKRHPHDVVVTGTTVYWMEGASDVYRLAVDESPVGQPELVARRQNEMTSLAADETGVYWVAQAPEGGGTAIYAAAAAERR